MIEIILIILNWLSGGFDWIVDFYECWNIIPLTIEELEDKNDLILNGLFSELRSLISQEEYFNFLNNLQDKYHINLSDVKDMVYEVQEKIKKDLYKILNEIKNK